MLILAFSFMSSAQKKQLIRATLNWFEAADRSEQMRGNQFTEQIITLLLGEQIYFEFWIPVFALIAVTARVSDVRGCQNAEWVNGHDQCVCVCVWLMPWQVSSLYEK